jgi:hypothetical protein
MIPYNWHTKSHVKVTHAAHLWMNKHEFRKAYPSYHRPAHIAPGQKHDLLLSASVHTAYPLYPQIPLRRQTTLPIFMLHKTFAEFIVIRSTRAYMICTPRGNCHSEPPAIARWLPCAIDIRVQIFRQISHAQGWNRSLHFLIFLFSFSSQICRILLRQNSTFKNQKTFLGLYKTKVKK